MRRLGRWFIAGVVREIRAIETDWGYPLWSWSFWSPVTVYRTKTRTEIRVNYYGFLPPLVLAILWAAWTA